MSLTNVKPFFQGQLEGLGYQEWPDGFNFENIPSNLLNGSYHLLLGSIAGVKQNQTDQELTQAVEIRLFFKGYADPAAAVDEAQAAVEAVLRECVKPASRVATTGLLNVLFEQATIDPLGLTNDNSVVVTLSFSVRVLIGL